MSPEDRAAVLAQVGAPPDDAASVEVAPKERKKKATSDSASDVLARILKNAGASKEAALAMCDTEAQAFFDARKITKVEAARRGLDDRSVHNKPLWDEAQTLRNTLKTGVRKHFQERTVATKIKATSKKAEDKRDDIDDAELEAFVASEAFRAAFAEHVRSLKNDDD